MTAPTVDAEPVCPGTAEAPTPTPPAVVPALRAVRRPFSSVPASIWDALAACNPWSTPFSAWAFHRAWWDAYGENAHEETLVVAPSASLERDDAPVLPVAIVPLMHRHEVEPSDALTRTTMRHGTGSEPDLTPIAPTAKAVFFGASYHADYATILVAPGDLRAASAAVVDYLTGPHAGPWDVVDLRRLRCGDPVADELGAAFGSLEIDRGWTVNIEREDVCPVVTLPVGVDFDGYLATLGKKERHEVRRKIRRAEAIGEIRLDDSTAPLDDLEAFIDLHQRRWGSRGLFPATQGGGQSRVFFQRLFELFGADGPLRLTFLTVGGRRIAAGIHFETGDGYLYYNAGVDPEANSLSPGVLMVAAYAQRALASGKRRLDFMRGREPYKYEWGARDEAIQRVLVRRRD